MQIAVIAAQIVVALIIFNVWLLRLRRPTAWRGGGARSLREEFAVYGLPGWAMLAIGGLKLAFATLLIAGIWVPSLVLPASLGLAALMLGAVAMHVRVGDPLMRSLPAAIVLALCVFVAVAGAGMTSVGS